MTRVLMALVVWLLALAAAGRGDAERWRMLAAPLTAVTGIVAIGIFALGAGGIVYYGAGIVRLHHGALSTFSTAFLKHGSPKVPAGKILASSFPAQQPADGQTTPNSRGLMGQHCPIVDGHVQKHVMLPKPRLCVQRQEPSGRPDVDRLFPQQRELIMNKKVEQVSGHQHGSARDDRRDDPKSSPKSNGDFSNRDKDPDDWTTGDEPMTGAQASYLKTLTEEAGETFDPDVSKAEASKRIDALQEKTGRGS